MSNILRKLFDGEIYPTEMNGMDTPELKAIDSEYYTLREQFEKKLTGDLAAEYEKLYSKELDFTYEKSFDCFRKGFIFAVHFIIEGMTKFE